MHNLHILCIMVRSSFRHTRAACTICCADEAQFSYCHSFNECKRKWIKADLILTCTCSILNIQEIRIMYCILGRRKTCIFLININCVKSGATSYCWQMWELSMRCQYYVLFVNLQPHYIPTIVISFAISYFEYNLLGICFKCKSSNISRITDTWTEWNILEKITRFIFNKTKKSSPREW